MRLELNLHELKRLDCSIRSQYHRWVASAPDSYRSDNFFPSRVPICVTARFGQNHEIGVNEDQECMTWQTDRDWSRIRYVNVALATHMSINPVEHWDAEDIDELEDAYHEGIFDSDDIATRNRLTREQLQAILDADVGTILPRVYSNRGYIVETHMADLGERPYAVLVKAGGLHDAFAPLPTPAVVVHPMQINAGDEPQDQVPAVDAPPTSATPFFFYPQAGLRSVGHFQADGLVSTCYPIVGRLNQRLRSQNVSNPDPHSDDSDDDMDGVDYTSTRRRVVEPIASQGYNAMMHHTRGRSAQHHDAQLGLVTAAISGQWATPGTNSARAYTLSTQCHYEMPHESFNTKIQPDDLGRDLRLENVYCFNMLALAPRRRCGDVIVTDIIMPLLRIWDHGSTRASINNHIQLFHPTAYPALYSWTTYPLTALLDHIFTEAEEVYAKDKFRHTLLVEVCSVVERGLNYMHTGNAAVIASSVMSPLWIGKALVTDGFPCFNTDIVRIHNGKRLTVSAPNWPMAADSARPLSSSRATQLFRYDKRHFNAFYAHLAMGIVVAKPPPPFIKESNELRQRAFAIMAYCVVLFIDDCKDLVSTEVMKALKRQRLLPLPQSAYASSRQSALNRWKESLEPLSYGKERANTYASLLSSISEDPNGEPPAGTEVTECLSYVDVAKLMLAGTHSSTSVRAPLWKHGACLTALEIAIVEIQHLLNVPIPDSEGIIAGILATTLRDLKVDYVPWHAPSRSTRGTTHVVSHLHWMSIDRTNPFGPQLAGNAQHHPASARMTQIQQVAVNRALTDRSSEWRVPVNVSHMDGLWEKSVLPLDWNWTNAFMTPTGGPPSHAYMRDTYLWAQTTYNKGNWKHHMALVWAILVTTILPNLHVPNSSKDRLRGYTNLGSLNQAIRNLKWEPPESTKKGLKDRGPFITMVTTYIMALMDPSSPLLTNLGERGGFGDPWTKKHNPKYIHGLLVVRLGIADARAPSVATVPKYDDNFEIRSDRQLRTLYDRIMSLLSDRKHGVYFAVCELFSTEMGVYAVDVKGHGSRPVVHSSQSS
ncbi:hypothetical protein Agabi119p4_2290 [Agaricus bisporus var. burnettii]|uniref:Uncharacterized protein n=1 Tax=Agaricus bisporus var. burnettii TaxID=192524 RepID=A0A8H7F8V6_AGABI|nr:hypothetical protein Agabi119p4_2290 [Agaricus bisporus var. burnettii]